MNCREIRELLEREVAMLALADTPTRLGSADELWRQAVVLESLGRALRIYENDHALPTCVRFSFEALPDWARMLEPHLIDGRAMLRLHPVLAPKSVWGIVVVARLYNQEEHFLSFRDFIDCIYRGTVIDAE